MLRTLMIAVCLTMLVASASAQDPVKVDPQHYKVESENARVRILRVNYGPHEKSPMHDHPDSVAVFLTDGHVKFTIEGGKTNEQTFKAGEARLTPGGKHAPENLSDQPFELILIELKNQAQTPSSPSNLSGVVR